MRCGGDSAEQFRYLDVSPFPSSAGASTLSASTCLDGCSKFVVLAAGFSGSASIAVRMSSSISVVAFLNSRIDLPKDLNSSGRRLAPKSNKTIRKIRSISGPLIF